MNLSCLRWVSDPGFESIELMLEVRERLFQISQFFRAGISNHTMLPRRDSKTGGGVHQAGHATHQNLVAVERPPEWRPLHGKQCDVSCWI